MHEIPSPQGHLRVCRWFPVVFAARVGVLVVISALSASCVNLSYPPGASRDGSAPAAQKAAGQACAEDRECQSAICSFGTCCKTLCDGPCVSCALEGSEGVCMPAPEGKNPRGLCKADPKDPCGDNGTCDGAGKCAKVPPGTTCGEAKCVFAETELPPRCNAAGVCEPSGKKLCKPFACGPDGNCLTMCSMQDHCANGNDCDLVSNTCGKKALGTACAGGGECFSGFCSPQNVCCDKACTGACEACNLKGSEGVCTNVPAGMPPPTPTSCPTSDVATCGLDGKCNGAGACRLYPAGTVCNPATCSTATLRNAGTCDGQMHCQVPAAVSCGGYTCAPMGAACRTTCASDLDCVSTSVCGGPTGAKACGGLSAQYFRQTNLTDLAFSRTDPNIDFDWHGGSPSPLLNVDNFSVRWRGKLTARYTDTYIFYAATDDGERLSINGTIILDHYVRHSSVPEDVSGAVMLTAGKPVDITFEYFENGGDANVRLSWAGSKFEPKAVIPTSALSPQ
jgi:hypothetical protein